MSRPKRSCTKLQPIYLSFSCDEPEEKTDKKRTKRKQNTRRNHIPDPVAVIPINDSDDEDLPDFATSSTLKSNVQKKVDNFFKFSGLISDDEDDIKVVETCDRPPVAENLQKSSSSKPTQSDVVETVVLGEDDTNDISAFGDIQNYCEETDNILKNANALLEKFIGTSSSEEPKQQETTKVDDEQSSPSGRLGECPVCYDKLSKKQIITTKCGHLFCMECIQSVILTVKKCPICRKSVNKKNIVPIYI